MIPPDPLSLSKSNNPLSSLELSFACCFFCSSVSFLTCACLGAYLNISCDLEKVPNNCSSKSFLCEVKIKNSTVLFFIFNDLFFS